MRKNKWWLFFQVNITFSRTSNAFLKNSISRDYFFVFNSFWNKEILKVTSWNKTVTSLVNKGLGPAKIYVHAYSYNIWLFSLTLINLFNIQDLLCLHRAYLSVCVCKFHLLTFLNLLPVQLWSFQFWSWQSLCFALFLSHDTFPEDFM